MAAPLPGTVRICSIGSGISLHREDVAWHSPWPCCRPSSTEPLTSSAASRHVARPRSRPLAIAGIAVAIASVALISRHQDATRGGGRRDRSLAIGLACGVVIGAFFVCLARAGSASGVWPLLIARAASTAALAAAAGMAKVPIAIPRTVLPVVIACGVIDMVANALYLIAVREGPLGLVATLASLYPASTVLLARVVFRERLQPVQSVGLACAAAAIVMITTR